VTEDCGRFEQLYLLVLGEHELGCFAPVRAMLPAMFDQARGVSIYLDMVGVPSAAVGKGRITNHTFEQLSHTNVVARFLPDPLPEVGLFSGGGDIAMALSSPEMVPGGP
jgi:hypothetical protein